MIYDYACPVCGMTVELDQSIYDSHTAPICECGSYMNRNWKSIQIRGDEFGSCYGYDHTKRRTVKTHGGHYDIGLGAYVDSKSQRERLMKAQNVHPCEGKEADGVFAEPGELERRKENSDRKLLGLAET